MKAYIIYPYYNNEGNGPGIEGYTDVIKANNLLSALIDKCNKYALRTDCNYCDEGGV